jgi:maltoporin
MEDEANPSRITCTGGSGTGDKGNYAATSKPTSSSARSTWSCTPTTALTRRRWKRRLNAWQGGVVLSHTNDSGVNKVIARYSDNSDNSVFTTKPMT